MLRFVDRRNGLTGHDMDATLLHLEPQPGAQVVVKAAQDVLAPIDLGDLDAEPGEDAGELDRDIAAPLDQYALRQRFEMKCLVG